MEYEEKYFLILGILRRWRMREETVREYRGWISAFLIPPWWIDNNAEFRTVVSVKSESRSHYDTVIEYVKYMLFWYFIALYAEYAFQCIKSGKNMQSQLHYWWVSCVTSIADLAWSVIHSIEYKWKKYNCIPGLMSKRATPKRLRRLWDHSLGFI